MNLKDYLHLYLGCEVKALVKWRNYSIGNTYKLNTAILNDFEVNLRAGKVICVPILRNLNSMTEKEKDRLEEIERNITVMFWRDIRGVDAQKTIFLLSKHFDLFGLIESGLAIDKTNINNLFI